MNRLWILWCSLSGADPDDSKAKMAFNVDRRVATLSAHHADLVEGFANYVWYGDPGMTSDVFLAKLVAEVSADEMRRQDAANRALETAAVERREAETRAREAHMAEVVQDREERERHREAEAILRGPWDEAQPRTIEDHTSAIAAVAMWSDLAESPREADRTRSVTVRREISCLYNIVPVVNLARIASRGLLCHDLAMDVRHDDVSDEGVQDLRVGRSIDGRPLHRFANLYLNPRNAMLYRLHRGERRDVVVLEVSAEVLDLPGVVVTDGNAASGQSRSWLATEGLAHIDLPRIRARSWRDDAGETDAEIKRIMQAEVLVPDSVPIKYISGFLAPSQATLDRALSYVGHWSGRISRDTFFE